MRGRYIISEPFTGKIYKTNDKIVWESELIKNRGIPVTIKPNDFKLILLKQTK